MHLHLPGTLPLSTVAVDSLTHADLIRFLAIVKQICYALFDDRQIREGDVHMTAKMISALKPSQRRDEADRQVASSQASSALDGIAEVTWAPSAFDQPRTQRFRIHGTSRPLDANGRDSLVVSGPDDAQWLTIGLHRVDRIAPVVTP
jgi:hypothetical protein